MLALWQLGHFEGHVCVSKHFPHLCHDLSLHSKKSRSFSVFLNFADCAEGQIVRRCVGLLRAIDLVSLPGFEVSPFQLQLRC